MPYDKSVVVPLPADETFALITQPERLRRWNSIAARIDVRAGGEYRWNIVPGNYAAGTLREVDPGRRVVMGWGWEGSDVVPPDTSTVTITLEPTHDGTIVRLVHEGLDEEQSKAHAEGWDHYLDRLVTAGADGDAGPDRWSGALEDYDELKAAEAALAINLRVLRNIGIDDLGNPSPCEGYTVSDVADHLTNSIVTLAGGAGATLTPAPCGNLEVDIADLAQPALEAWAKRGLDGTVDIGVGDMPASFVVGILAVEFLVHAWDFATATGQKLTVDEDLATYVLGLSKRVVKDELRRPGFFDPEIPVGPEANGLEQLIAFTGRAA